jgi:AcrR family transcriptional regulator
MGRRRLISDARLLAVARDLFVERGPSASTREIARRAHVSEGVLFQRFGTKVELYFAALAPPGVEFDREPAKGLSRREARKWLDSFVRRLVDYFRRLAPVLGPLMTQSEFRFEEFARRYPESSLVVLRREVTRVLASAQEKGLVGPGPVGPAALLVISLAHTIAVFERLGAHDSRFPETFIRSAVHCLWRGLSPADP